MNKKYTQILLALLILLFSYTITQLFSMSDIYDRINNGIYDAVFRITKNGDKRTKSAGIVVINDLALNYMEEKYQYTWPWPRSVYGLMSDFLISKGAKAVVFDVVFNNPDYDREKLGMTGYGSDSYFKSVVDKTGKIVIALNIDDSYESHTIPDPITQETLLAIYNSENDENKQLIKDAYQFDDNYGFFTVNASFLNGDDENRKKLSMVINGSPYFYNPTQIISDYQLQNISKYNFLRFPYSVYAQNNPYMGFVENYTDRDGTIREYKPIVSINKRKIPSLALAAYVVSEKKMPQNLSLSKKGNFILKWYGPGGITTDSQGNQKTNTTFDYFSAHYIFDAAREEIIMKRKSKIPDSDIKDRVFFVGNISKALLDQKNTPFSAGGTAYPGVEIHATGFINMLYNDYMKIPNFYLEILLYLIPIFLVSLTGLKSQTFKVHIFFVLFVLFVILFMQFILFKNYNMICNTTYFMLLILFSIIFALSLNYIIVGKNRNLIKNALGMYISPALEREITASGKPLAITGESVIATAMFIDIAGFTTFSEKNTASKVVEILNVYLNVFSEYIMNKFGFVNKFLGDGLMALFGTITPLENHADLALDSAIECLNKTEELNPQFGLDIRIGINSGEMIKGNMGGAKRLEFTAIGDNVNLASRLEGANKFFGTKIILGENSYDSLKNSEHISNILFLGRFCVKGKAIPIRFYAYYNLEKEEKDRFSNFLDVYYNKDKAGFEKLMEYYKVNRFKPADIYIEHYLTEPDEFGMPIKFTEK
ncbi:MAG: hypothetical protein A2015_00545 [Spirochaetes bacterium GWF1_31_7]|nr:MAG: hypothetical protein A2Y30_03965 [Spirochaetes bacterium GWE1_32_154]OHD45161.1 MAG: hypothetical protein A2Y29_15930 [Spirochaetes bacterium GWE2_31_10]OHD51071.1 MAG: hypothetical protein A2015_00545 [Spirochaetes bacterium GWF1_31_7]OHD80602.1 MAG: hypothetical protein A2355_07725 [Spirochaetes bacterium RIFOXYB1_FULL_32_8]HBD94395.1 hypothetical protein [Spirochaetia bacterium]